MFFITYIYWWFIPIALIFGALLIPNVIWHFLKDSDYWDAYHDRRLSILCCCIFFLMLLAAGAFAIGYWVWR